MTILFDKTCIVSMADIATAATVLHTKRSCHDQIALTFSSRFSFWLRWCQNALYEHWHPRLLSCDLNLHLLGRKTRRAPEGTGILDSFCVEICLLIRYTGLDAGTLSQQRWGCSVECYSYFSPFPFLNLFFLSVCFSPLFSLSFSLSLSELLSLLLLLLRLELDGSWLNVTLDVRSNGRVCINVRQDVW